MPQPSDLALNHAFTSVPAAALVLVLVTALFAPSPATGQARKAGVERLTILHTNDLHGHVTPWVGWEGKLTGRSVGGAGRVATAVKRAREEAGPGNTLLLDAGDALGDTMLAKLTRGQVVFDVMSVVGYDAMTIGNHDPDFTMDRLGTLAAKAGFPVVAVNVEPAGQPFWKPFITLERGGVTVAVVGLAYPNTALTTPVKNLAGATFGHDPEGVQAAVKEARAKGAQLVVVLSHGGLQADEKLASMVEGIDVIVGGHSHNPIDDVITVGSTLLVSAGAHGSHLGRLDLEMREGRVTGHERSLVVLDDSVPADAEVDGLVKEAARPFREQLDEVVGQAREVIPRADTLGGDEPSPRDHQSPADVLFAKILRERAGADVAMLPGVGYGVALQPGPITAAALRNLLPHDSKVVTVTLSGRQVREILEQSLHNVYTSSLREKVGGIVQVSGLRFEFDASREKGSRVLKVEVAGKPLDESASYRVVTNSLPAQGGHNYRTFLEGRDRQEGPEEYEVVKARLAKAGPVSAPPADGAVKVGGQK